MPRPIKGKGDGRPIAFPDVPWHREKPEFPAGLYGPKGRPEFRKVRDGYGPMPGCPVRGGSCELCDDDHCRELDVDPGDGYQGSWEHMSGHGPHYGRF